jgi:hypothetical protein
MAVKGNGLVVAKNGSVVLSGGKSCAPESKLR